jgi:hypothetical protein
MAYIGNVPAEAYTNTVKDSFNGTGSATAFTLSQPSVTNDVRVVVENVVQDPTVAYSVSGTTLTFTSAPVSGTDNIYVVHLGPAVMTTIPPAEIAGATTFASSVSVQGAFTSLGIDDNAAATAVTIAASGNVGVGTASPDGRIHSHIASAGAITANTSANGVVIENSGQTGLSVLTPNASTANIFFGDTDSATVGRFRYDHSVNAMSFWTDNTERMRIDSSGNVGIGTSSPSAKLELDRGTSDGEYFRASSNNRRHLVVSNGVGDNSNADALHNFNASGADGVLSFSTASTEAMRIDSSGSVFVGCTSAPNGSVVGSAFIKTSFDYELLISCSVTSSQKIVKFYNPNGEVGSISTNGSATAYNTSSDYRLKEDWQPMSGASERVQALKPVNFAWKLDGSRVDGFLAHELQEVVPEAATGTKDAMQDEEYEVSPAVLDDEGNVVTEAEMGTRSVPDMQGIDQAKIVPLLTAALQEALTKIDDLETRLAAVEGSNP